MSLLCPSLVFSISNSKIERTIFSPLRFPLATPADCPTPADHPPDLSWVAISHTSCGYTGLIHVDVAMRPCDRQQGSRADFLLLSILRRVTPDRVLALQRVDK